MLFWQEKRKRKHRNHRAWKIGQLEAEDISLEEAFTAYSKGMSLLKQCNEQIDRVEKQVMKLNEEGGLEPLDPQ